MYSAQTSCTVPRRDAQAVLPCSVTCMMGKSTRLKMAWRPVWHWKQRWVVVMKDGGMCQR